MCALSRHAEGGQGRGRRRTEDSLDGSSHPCCAQARVAREVAADDSRQGDERHAALRGPQAEVRGGNELLEEERREMIK